MHVENIVLKGIVNLVLTGPDGEVKEDITINNLVVDVGLAFIASRMKDATATAMTHMAVGTTNTAAADAQTVLVAESARVALTSSTIATTNVANDSLTYVATFPAGTGTATLVEAGILNNSSGGTMLCRTVFGSIVKGALDTLTITWKVVVA